MLMQQTIAKVSCCSLVGKVNWIGFKDVIFGKANLKNEALTFCWEVSQIFGLLNAS